MREASERDLVASLAAEVPREARDLGARPDLDHVPDHHPGKFEVELCM